MFLNLLNLPMLIKRKILPLSRNLALRTFDKLVNSDLNKDKFPIPVLFDHSKVFPSTSDKAKLPTKNFSKNYNIYDSGVSLPVFPSTTNVKLHISVTSKLVK